MTDTHTFLEFQRHEWMAQAACKGQPTAMFFPERGATGGLGDVRAMCEGCPVRQPCADVAIADPMMKGVWGGLSERQRQHLRRGVVVVRKARKPPPHGTRAMAERHYRAGEKPCEECREALNATATARKTLMRERKQAARRDAA